MIDETNNNNEGFGSTTTSNPGTAFCQDCGKPLAPEEMRRVGSSVFCEPCLVRRSAVPPPPVNAAPGVPYSAHIPSPTVAGWLGLIPGVGAMYNGQFPKGFAHIVIFAVLDMFAKHVSDVFGVAVCGWIVYQVFDAVHTARARRDGLPLPDYLGLNNIGERLGASAPRYNPTTGWTAPPPPPPGAPSAANPEPVAQAPAAPWTPVPPAPPFTASPAHQANWAGYIPPTAFSSAPYTPPQPNAMPYQPLTQPLPMDMPIDTSNRFPMGAVILIAAGVIFMIANFVPEFHISGSWITALILIAATAFSLVKRTAIAERLRAEGDVDAGPVMLQLYRFPITLGILALLFVLQALHIAGLEETWPVMLVTAGVMLFAARAMQPRVIVPPASPWPMTPPPPPAAPAAESITEERHE